jgi:branched-subunit amino acid transport protein
MSTFEAALTILALGGVSVLTRAFFLLSQRELPMPAWLRQGLRHAPLAALAAVVAPEILLDHGHLVGTLRDARLGAAVVATLVYVWRRDILWTIVSGTAAMVALRVGLGW